MVKQVVGRQGGTIALESRGGEGRTVTLKLPATTAGSD